MVQAITSNVNNGCKWDAHGFPGWWDTGDSSGHLLSLPWLKGIVNIDYSQPVHLLVVGEAEDEFIDNPVNTHRSANKFKRSVVGIVEDEIIEIEFAQLLSADSSS